jgi:hypothetical protein
VRITFDDFDVEGHSTCSYDYLEVSGQVDWLIEWLIDWLNDWLNDWLIDWLNDWLIDWLIEQLYAHISILPLKKNECRNVEKDCVCVCVYVWVCMCVYVWVCVCVCVGVDVCVLKLFLYE